MRHNVTILVNDHCHQSCVKHVASKKLDTFVSECYQRQGYYFLRPMLDPNMKYMALHYLSKFAPYVVKYNTTMVCLFRYMTVPTTFNYYCGVQLIECRILQMLLKFSTRVMWWKYNLPLPSSNSAATPPPFLPLDKLCVDHSNQKYFASCLSGISGLSVHKAIMKLYPNYVSKEKLYIYDLVMYIWYILQLHPGNNTFLKLLISSLVCGKDPKS
jgi:hypothetical protein